MVGLNKHRIFSQEELLVPSTKPAPNSEFFFTFATEEIEILSLFEPRPLCIYNLNHVLLWPKPNQTGTVLQRSGILYALCSRVMLFLEW